MDSLLLLQICNYLQGKGITTKAAARAHVNGLTSAQLTTLLKKVLIVQMKSAIDSAQFKEPAGDPSL